MTVQKIRARAPISQTATARLFAETGVADTVLYESTSFEEQESNAGSYIFTFTQVSVIPAAVYKITVVDDADPANPLSSGYVKILGTDGETAEAYALPDPARAAVIAALIAGIASSVGPGADSVTIHIEDDDVPEENVDVWISTDVGGLTVVAGTRSTDASGNVTFLLTAGATYYLWAQKAGKIDIQGQEFVAVAD